MERSAGNSRRRRSVHSFFPQSPRRKTLGVPVHASIFELNLGTQFWHVFSSTGLCLARVAHHPEDTAHGTSSVHRSGGHCVGGQRAADQLEQLCTNASEIRRAPHEEGVTVSASEEHRATTARER